MAELIDLGARRSSVFYTIEIEHRWDGGYSLHVRDVADDKRSRDAVRDLILRMAEDIRAGELFNIEAPQWLS